MSWQRTILAAGFAVLAAFSAVSIGLDVKSRSEAAWVTHTLEVSNKLADMRLRVRRAYRTFAVADGCSALEHLERGLPLDLLFTDVVMPGGMTGRQLADEVARRRPGTKVLYTSGYTENAVMHHGRLDQGVTLLSKPYRKSELARMVRLALRDAADGRHLQPILLADTSILVPMPRQPASSQALSSS